MKWIPICCFWVCKGYRIRPYFLFISPLISDVMKLSMNGLQVFSGFGVHIPLLGYFSSLDQCSTMYISTRNCNRMREFCSRMHQTHAYKEASNTSFKYNLPFPYVSCKEQEKGKENAMRCLR